MGQKPDGSKWRGRGVKGTVYRQWFWELVCEAEERNKVELWGKCSLLPLCIFFLCFWNMFSENYFEECRKWQKHDYFKYLTILNHYLAKMAISHFCKKYYFVVDLSEWKDREVNAMMNNSFPPRIIMLNLCLIQLIVLVQSSTYCFCDLKYDKFFSTVYRINVFFQFSYSKIHIKNIYRHLMGIKVMCNRGTSHTN